MKFAAVATLFSLPLLAAATPLEARWGTSSTCSTGSLQCCDSTISSTSAEATFIVDILEGLLGTVTGIIGMNCSPVTDSGVGDGNTCSANAVCCTNNNVGGLFSVGCSPFTL